MAKIAETRADVAKMNSDLSSKLAHTRSDLDSKLAEARSDLGARLAETRSDLIVRIAETAFDLLKWLLGAIGLQTLAVIIAISGGVAASILGVH